MEFATAPLAPGAAGALVGILVDRTDSVPLAAAFVVSVAGVLLAVLMRKLAMLGIAIAACGLAAAHHHLHRHQFDADDIGQTAAENGQLVRIRGFIDEVPAVRLAGRSEFSGGLQRHDRGQTVLAVSQVEASDGWVNANGRALVVVDRIVADAAQPFFHGLTLGDEVELFGQLTKPTGPSNPGERDYSLYLQDRRIRAVVHVHRGDDGVTRLKPAEGFQFARWLAQLRGHFTSIIHDALAGTDAALARALLLGDGTATDRAEWDAFARTGVVHVLVISGQHLVVLAAAVWLVLRVAGLPRKAGAAVVIALVMLYALVTGGQPSALRAALMVSVYCGAMLSRRRAHTANTLALAWLVLAALDPAEAVSTGSKLSFISVFCLIWGAGRWFAPRPLTAIEQLQYEARPPWRNALHSLWRMIWVAYAVNLTLTVVNAPLLVFSNNLVPLISILIGPPVVLLTTVALLAGFVMLLLGLVSSTLAAPLAWVTGLSLNAARDVVHAAQALPGGTIYVPDVPACWVAGFYMLLAIAVLFASRRVAMVMVMWTLSVLFTGPGRQPNELRVMFLAVGHGGCTVLEAPDGRVLMYDCGTMAGPDAVRKIIAPALWQRGIRRVDELFLSHADLDHYGCVPELLKRFSVGRVTLTPSFSLKHNAEVVGVLRELDAHRVPRHIATAGELLTAGEVLLEVLHPPAEGPPGIENERSLVLLVTHANHTLLLTGDLERAGTQYLLNQKPRSIDAFMAPHHGARAALPPALVAWADPGLVIVSRGARTGWNDALGGRAVWDTHTFGAITLTSHDTGLVAESFRTKQRIVVPPRERTRP
jgi:competence protein ComEC